MDILAQFIDFVLHVNVHLAAFLAEYGAWTYLLLFCIIFCETGLVVTPILPGDSLLFVTGALAGAGLMHAPTIIGLLAIAALAGDTVNYWIGRRVGPAIFEREKTRFIKKAHLVQAHEFYERHGGKAIVLGRFLPIIRTFAPSWRHRRDAPPRLRFLQRDRRHLLDRLLHGHRLLLRQPAHDQEELLHRHLRDHRAFLHSARPGSLEGPPQSPRRRKRLESVSAMAPYGTRGRPAFADRPLASRAFGTRQASRAASDLGPTT